VSFGAVLVEDVAGRVGKLTGLRVDQEQLLLHADLAHPWHAAIVATPTR
jgi:hypothetical protein